MGMSQQKPKPPKLDGGEDVELPDHGVVGTIASDVNRMCKVYLCRKHESLGQVYHKKYVLGFGISEQLWEDYFDPLGVERAYMWHVETDDIYEFPLEKFRQEGSYETDRDPQYVLEHTEYLWKWESLGQNIWHYRRNK